MRILVLNCGSSSIKFQVFRILGQGKFSRTVRGAVSALGRGAVLSSSSASGGETRIAVTAQTHVEAVQHILTHLDRAAEAGTGGEPIAAVGHRVVHGGHQFRAPTLVTESVLHGLKHLEELAPLHNGPSVSVIHAMAALLDVPQVAVFDTAFHANLPEVAWRYAIPFALAERHGIRKFGFHGISYRYVLDRLAALTGTPVAGLSAVLLHLGHGASAAAVRNGVCVDTTMGFTPLEGLMMGTRSGDLDPSLVEFIAEHEGLALEEVVRMLNAESGLLGVSGLASDMERLLSEERSIPRAALAVDMFCYRARKAVGALLAALGGAEHIAFTGGIGEHAPAIRARICGALGWLGLHLDGDANAGTRGHEGCISVPGSRVKVWVVPTDEELQIVRDSAALLDLRAP